MKSDGQLKKDVESGLEWDPAIDASPVGVLVKDGVVTLTGHLDSYAAKYAAERAAAQGAAWSAPGITSVVNQLHVA